MPVPKDILPGQAARYFLDAIKVAHRYGPVAQPNTLGQPKIQAMPSWKTCDLKRRKYHALSMENKILISL